MSRSLPSTSRAAGKRPNGAGSYYPIAGTKKYKVAITDVRGKRRTKVVHNEIAAQEWLIEQKKLREHGNSAYAVRPKDTVTTFLNRYLDSREGDVKYLTMKSYRGSVRRLHPLIGDLNAAKLTPRAIETAYAQLRQSGYQAGTLKAAHRLLSAAYNDAFRLQEIPTNPMINVKTPSQKSTPTQAIPRKDMEKIYRAALAHSPYTLARIDIGFTTGLRPGEVFGLLWSDIDFDNQTMTIARQVQYVPGKGRDFQTVKQEETRTIPLTSRQIEILLKHREIQELQKGFWPSDRGLIFPNSDGGMKDDSKDRKEFKALCVAAGVPPYQVYQMRKTCFTNMATSGVDIATVKSFSGHRQTSTLITSYVFATNESLHNATEKIDALRPELNL